MGRFPIAMNFGLPRYSRHNPMTMTAGLDTYFVGWPWIKQMGGAQKRRSPTALRLGMIFSENRCHHEGFFGIMLANWTQVR